MQNCNCNWYEYRSAYLLVSIEENQNKPKKEKKKKNGEKFMLNLKFCVEALNNSGQSNTQEKKMCSVLFN